MSVTWNVIKYVPDSFRFEPKNIGVIVMNDSEVALQFIGELPKGRVDGRRARGLRIDAENYRKWVSYFRRKAESGRWEDVRQAMRRRPDFQFYVDEGGWLPSADETPLEDTLQSLYRDLVEADDTVAVGSDLAAVERPETLPSRVGRIFRAANLQVRRDLSVPALFAAGPASQQDIRTEVTFSFGHENGHLHLMEPVALPSAAYGFFARAEAAHKVNPQLRFLAFYRSGTFQGHEHDLEVIENYANTVDVDGEDMASIANQVKDAVSSA